MRATTSRLFVIASALALLSVNLLPNQAIARGTSSQAKPASQAQPAAPAKQVLRRVRPNHVAILHMRRHHGRHTFAHHLYGPPADLSTHRHRFHGPVSNRRTRRLFITVDHRNVKIARPHARRDSTGCPTGWTCADIGSDSPTGTYTYSGTGELALRARDNLRRIWCQRFRDE